MTSGTHKILGGILTCWLAAASTPAVAQTPDFLLNAPPSAERVVTGAPYSGEATTTLKLVLFDGDKIERNVTARIYRDSAGRIRREQTVIGLDPLKPSSDGSASVVTIVDPVAGVIYTLNPATHTAHRLAMAKDVNTATPVMASGMPSPSLTKEESLGAREIDGLTATGTRTVTTIPAGQIGNGRAVDISDERWESTDLKVLLQSRHHNPQNGDVEYRLTNVRRAEPARELFTVPAGYRIVEGS